MRSIRREMVTSNIDIEKEMQSKDTKKTGQISYKDFTHVIKANLPKVSPLELNAIYKNYVIKLAGD